MAESSGKVGNLFFGMTLDPTDFKKKLKDAKNALKEAGNSMREDLASIAKGGAVIVAGIGAASAAMLAFATSTLEASNAQIILANSIGATQSQIAGLELAATRLGVESSMLIDKMREFGGIDEFSKLADDVKGAGGAQEQLNKAIEIFGGEGAKLLPVLQLGSKGLQEMERDALSLGQALNPEQIAATTVAWSAFEETLLRIQGLGKQIGTAFAEPLGLLSTAVSAFVDTFRDDILGAFEFVAESMTSFIKGAIDIFVQFGIPLINGFVAFINQVGEAFQVLFEFISPATDKAAAGIGDLFKGLIDFLATFRQQLTILISAPIEALITGLFNMLAKFSGAVGDLLTEMAFGLAELGAVSEDFASALGEAFEDQRISLRRQGKEFAEPFRQATETATQEISDILVDQDKKNTAQQSKFSKIVTKFNLNFKTAVDEAGKNAEKNRKAIDEQAKISDKFAGLILSGSQEEARILNQTRNQELEETIKNRKANQMTAKSLGNVGVV